MLHVYSMFHPGETDSFHQEKTLLLAKVEGFSSFPFHLADYLFLLYRRRCGGVDFPARAALYVECTQIFSHLTEPSKKKAWSPRKDGMDSMAMAMALKSLTRVYRYIWALPIRLFPFPLSCAPNFVPPRRKFVPSTIREKGIKSDPDVGKQKAPLSLY